jgi:cytosine/adenosine deaminase-related metal-dependent hydrolase
VDSPVPGRSAVPGRSQVALQAACLHPATVLGDDRKGRLSAGADADIVVLDRDLRTVATIIGGRVAHDPTGVLRALPPMTSGVPVP